MMDQVLRYQKYFVRWWAWYTWWSGAGLVPEVPWCSKLQNMFLPTILKVTEDDVLRFEISGIFHKVLSLVHLEFRRQPNIRDSEHQQRQWNFFPIFSRSLKMTDKFWKDRNFLCSDKLGIPGGQGVIWPQKSYTVANIQTSFSPPFSRVWKAMNQFLRYHEVFMRQQAWCTWRPGVIWHPRSQTSANHQITFFPPFWRFLMMMDQVLKGQEFFVRQ